MQYPEHLAHFASLFKKRDIAHFMSAPWLTSSFLEPVWKYNFGYKTDQDLDWRVHLYDGSLLTDPQHVKLLHSLQCWLIASTESAIGPSFTNSWASQAASFRRTITVIDHILQSAEDLELVEHGLSALTYDVMCDIIDQIGTSSSVAVSTYDWNNRLTDYCMSLLQTTSEESIDKCLEEHPPLADITPLQLEENTLDIPLGLIPRVRAALYINKMYHTNPNGGLNVNSKRVSALLYKDTLAGKNRLKPLHSILGFVWRVDRFIREFDSVPVTNGNPDRMTKRDLVLYRTAFTFLQKISALDFKLPSKQDLRDIAIFKVSGAEMGRFKNVPTPIIFKSIKDGIEFHFEHGPQLLKSYVSIAKYSVKHKVNITGIPDETILSLLEPSIADLGVQYLGISTRSSGRDPGTELKESKDVYFGKLRGNAGLLELIGVYYGAIQLLVGATMAKRGSELRSLDPINCLSEDKSWLIARIAKSSRGLKGLRARNARPIDPLAAEMVQTLIDFQKELIEIGFIDHHLPLFSSPGVIGTSSLTPCDVYLYYKNIDLFCDYFEVERDGQGRRYYIRQHQLRRFFALVFLHCGYGANAGILQWMFGHTDPAHIWNYITEELPGKELRNTLAQAVSEQMTTGGTTHYTDVIDLIEGKFGTRNVSVMDPEKLAGYFDFLMESGQMTMEPIFLESDTGFRVEILVVLRKQDELG
jgi:hypothetical protein